MGRQEGSAGSHSSAVFPLAVIKSPIKAIYRRMGLSGYSPSWLQSFMAQLVTPYPKSGGTERYMPALSSHYKVQNSSTGASHLN